MFEKEINTARLSAIIRWGKTFSKEKVKEARIRLHQIKKPKYLKRDKGISELLDLIGKGVI